MTEPPLSLTDAAVLLLDAQNDFLHPDGAYGRAGQTAASLAALPGKIAPLLVAARAAGVPILASQFTLPPGPGGEPLISPHLKRLRPFLTRGDFLPGAWGHAIVDELAPADYCVEKIAYSAFYMSRLEWLLRRLSARTLLVAGLVTDGGVASTVRDAHVRDFEIVLMDDGCAAFSAEAHATAIDSLRKVAHVTNIAEVIAALNAGGPAQGCADVKS